MRVALTAVSRYGDGERRNAGTIAQGYVNAERKMQSGKGLRYHNTTKDNMEKDNATMTQHLLSQKQIKMKK